MKREIEQAFLKFRRTGEPRWLGEVFDRTASELLVAAIHLADDADSAEDLVQATFLTAIRRCQSFDSKRLLIPWLMGILANHAKSQRRSSSRVVDVSRVTPSESISPLEVVSRGEDRRVVTAAIEKLNEPYRGVLMLHLRHGMRPADIAHVMKDTPGQVRVWIHRGVRQLKKTLPKGVGSFGLVAFPALIDVRAAVLNQAAKNLVAASSSSFGILGVVVLVKKICVVLVAIVLSVWMLAWYTDEGEIHQDLPRSSPQIVAKATLPREPRREVIANDDHAEPIAIENATGILGSGRFFVGNVIDGKSGEPVARASLEIHRSIRDGYIGAQRRWRDFAIWNIDGSPTMPGWPSLSENLDNSILLGQAKLEVKAPPPSGTTPLASSKSGAEGDFKIPRIDGAGILICRSAGYQDSYLVLGDSDDVGVVKVWRGSRLFGLVVDEYGKPPKIPLCFSFCSIQGGNQAGRWSVKTDSGGRFDLSIGASRVMMQCTTRGYVVNEVYSEIGRRQSISGDLTPGNSSEHPYRIVVQKIATIVVVDADSKDSIEDVFVVRRESRTGGFGISGRIFAPDGVIEVPFTGGFMASKESLREMWGNKSYQMKIWSPGYKEKSVVVSDLLSPSDGIVVELSRGAIPSVEGVLRRGSAPLVGAKVTARLIDASNRWQPNSGFLRLGATATTKNGGFSIAVPTGRYVLRIEEGDRIHCRVIDVPLREPVDIDMNGLASVVVVAKDAQGDPIGGCKLTLLGADQRWTRVETDEDGMGRFPWLPPGKFEVHVARGHDFSKTIFGFDLAAGETKELRLKSRVPQPPIKMRLLVEGQESFEGWIVKWRDGDLPQESMVADDGQVQRTIPPAKVKEVEVLSSAGQKWEFSVPRKIVEWDIPVDVNGYRQDFRMMDWFGKKPLVGILVRAGVVGDPTRGTFFAVSDDDGRFRLRGFGKGKCRLNFLIPQRREWRRSRSTLPEFLSIEMELDPAVAREELEIRLPILKRRGALSSCQVGGKVVRESGPVENSVVSVVNVFERGPYHLYVSMPGNRGRTDKNGNYSVVGLAGNRFRAWVQVPVDGKWEKRGPFEWSVPNEIRIIRRDFHLK